MNAVRRGLVVIPSFLLFFCLNLFGGRKLDDGSIDYEIVDFIRSFRSRLRPRLRLTPRENCTCRARVLILSVK